MERKKKEADTAKFVWNCCDWDKFQAVDDQGPIDLSFVGSVLGSGNDVSFFLRLSLLFPSSQFCTS